MRLFLIAIVTVFNSGYSLAQSKVEQAHSLYEQRKYDQVKRLLLAIDNEEADFAAAQYYLGRVAFDEKKYDDASNYFEEAVEANNRVADYHNWLGNTYGTIAQEANVFKKGILAPKMKKAWENAIALDAKNLEARTSLIQYYLQAPGFMGGSIVKAKEVAHQIIKLKPAEGHQLSP